MLKPIYIKSACALSPQETFDPENWFHHLRSSYSNRLKIIDIDYSKYISPVAIRRMSRMLKMGISVGMRSLELAGVSVPDGIIIGTGRGSATDMEQFLKDMTDNNETALNPTPFIQSTYNSINGWLAMQTKCTGYSQTFVHRGFSFELALLDAQLALSDTDEIQNYLVGCYDELTDDYFVVRDKASYWKKHPVKSIFLLQYMQTAGTIAGEGVSFFTVSNNKTNAICAITDIKMMHWARWPEPEAAQAAVLELLQKHGLETTYPDAVLIGSNGDGKWRPFYAEITQSIPADVTIASFKNVCGDYDTASGFAVWLATQIFANRGLTREIVLQKGRNATPRHLLIVNHYIMHSATLILMKLVD